MSHEKTEQYHNRLKDLYDLNNIQGGSDHDAFFNMHGFKTDLFDFQILPLLRRIEELRTSVETSDKNFGDMAELYMKQRERIEELEKEVEVNKPDKCPVTNLDFFMTIDSLHTYGGPYDSYTIPTRDDEGYFSRKRFDHDQGGWVEDEYIDNIVVHESDVLLLDDAEEILSKIFPRKTIPIPPKEKTNADDKLDSKRV